MEYWVKYVTIILCRSHMIVNKLLIKYERIPFKPITPVFHHSIVSIVSEANKVLF